MNDDILTIPEVASLLRIAEKTVYTLAQRAEIPAFKVGGQWRFSRGAIQAWIEERTRKSMPKSRNAGVPAAQTRTRRSR